MADHPLILPGWAVRAVLREIEAPGTGKSQHRVVLRDQPGELDRPFKMDDGTWHVTDSRGGHMSQLSVKYRDGGRLWVRETWAHDDPVPLQYRAGPHIADDALGVRWRSPVVMPRWASRLTLLVDDVRVQRVQDISEADAIAEGVEPLFSPEIAASRPEFHRDPMPWLNYLWHGHHDLTRKQVDAWRHQYSSYDTAVGSFSSLWERQHGSGAWARNPWVVALTFRPIPRNIDMEA